MNKKLMLGISAVILVIAFITGGYMGAEGGSKTSTAGKAREKNPADMTKAATKEKSQKDTDKESETATENETETTTEQILDTDKVVYLTFDDGPSDLTPQFIDTLNRYGVHATFFVTMQEGREDIYKQILENGNKIQIHTASHDYDTIYQSVDAYMADFDQIYNYIYNLTGVKCDIFRFPGGSNNSYGKNITGDIAREMRKRGMNYIDWNSSVGDGSASATKDSEIQKVAAESEGVQRVVLLAHDSGAKSETLAALPQIIDYYKSNGYKFGLISGDMNVSDFQFMKID